MKKLLAIAVAVLLAVAVSAAPKLPDYDGPVNDRVGVLGRGDIERLTSKVLAYREQSGNEIGVLIVATMGGQSIEDFAHDVFKAWGIGGKGKDNGVLFAVSIEERKARIEVGYGLEGELTDLECGRLVSGKSPMARHFRRGDYAAGVDAVIDGIIQAIGGEYAPAGEEDDTSDNGLAALPVLLLILIVLIFVIRRARSHSRRFGGPFFGGFGGGFGGGSLGGWSSGGGGGGGGGFSFGGGSSGGGGASGGW